MAAALALYTCVLYAHASPRARLLRVVQLLQQLQHESGPKPYEEGGRVRAVRAARAQTTQYKTSPRAAQPRTHQPQISRASAASMGWEYCRGRGGGAQVGDAPVASRGPAAPPSAAEARASGREVCRSLHCPVLSDQPAPHPHLQGQHVVAGDVRVRRPPRPPCPLLGGPPAPRAQAVGQAADVVWAGAQGLVVVAPGHSTRRGGQGWGGGKGWAGGQARPRAASAG